MKRGVGEMYSIQNEAATYVKCENITHYDRIQDRQSVPIHNVPSTSTGYRRGSFKGGDSSRDMKGVSNMELYVIFAVESHLRFRDRENDDQLCFSGRSLWSKSGKKR